MSSVTVPGENDILIFFSSLDHAIFDPDSTHSLFSHGELERAKRLPEGQARSRFLAGRSFLRRTLASLLDLKFEAILFEEGDWGKPRLAQRSGSWRISFNLTHSADLALLAVGGGPELGIDMEKIAGETPYLQIAQLFFSPLEIKDLVSLPANEQLAAFFRCWTRKEAYLKGCGMGLSLPPNAFDITLLPGSVPEIRTHRTIPSEKERWHIIDIAAPRGFCAALATEAKHPLLRYMDR